MFVLFLSVFYTLLLATHQQEAIVDMQGNRVVGPDNVWQGSLNEINGRQNYVAGDNNNVKGDNNIVQGHNNLVGQLTPEQAQALQSEIQNRLSGRFASLFSFGTNADIKSQQSYESSPSSSISMPIEQNKEASQQRPVESQQVLSEEKTSQNSESEQEGEKGVSEDKKEMSVKNRLIYRTYGKWGGKDWLSSLKKEVCRRFRIDCQNGHIRFSSVYGVGGLK